VAATVRALTRLQQHYLIAFPASFQLGSISFNISSNDSTNSQSVSNHNYITDEEGRNRTQQKAFSYQGCLAVHHFGREQQQTKCEALTAGTS